MASFFDTWEQADRDLSRGADAPTSKEAFEKVRPHLQSAREELYAWLTSRGDEGGTCREWARHKGIGMNQCSGRLTELKAQKRIRETGRKRDGCAVYIAIANAEGCDS